MSCGYCKELGHYKPTCLKYKADLLRNRLDNVSDNQVIVDQVSDYLEKTYGDRICFGIPCEEVFWIEL